MTFADLSKKKRFSTFPIINEASNGYSVVTTIANWLLTNTMMIFETVLMQEYFIFEHRKKKDLNTLFRGWE